MAQNQAKEAVEAYRRAAELTPNSAEFRYNMGNALRKSGDFAAAINAYREAVTLAPDYAVAWQGLARSYLLANRREEAADMFEKWLGKDPGNPVILFLQAPCLGKGAPDRAPNHYIEQVFDDLANSFDTHLIEHLEYRAPDPPNGSACRGNSGTDGNARYSGCRLRNRSLRTASSTLRPLSCRS